MKTWPVSGLRFSHSFLAWVLPPASSWNLNLAPTGLPTQNMWVIFSEAHLLQKNFAFALESGFSGILLFGEPCKQPHAFLFHYYGFLGSLFSAVWIVVANSWQQTPAGFHIVGEGMSARAEITDFWAMVFNPSSMERLMHVWIGAF